MANAIGVARGKPSNHSGDWRRALDKVGDLLAARCRRARELLAGCPTSENYKTLCLSDPAMDLLCDKKSSIRDDGDKVAHPNLDADELQDLLKALPDLSDIRARQGLDVVIKHLVRASPAETLVQSSTGQ